MAIKHKTVPKREIYNYEYNKDDFQSLNNDISNVDWNRVFSCNMTHAWHVIV